MAPDLSLAKEKDEAIIMMKCEADEYALLVEQMKNDGVINAKFSGLFRKAKQGFRLVCSNNSRKLYVRKSQIVNFLSNIYAKAY